jgi:hypothetical protein
MIINAILKINPNAEVTVKGNDINTCEITWHNGTAPISKADIEAMIPTVEAEIEQEKLDKEQANQSAIDKLKALGLTDSEIEAFRGK